MAGVTVIVITKLQLGEVNYRHFFCMGTPTIEIPSYIPLALALSLYVLEAVRNRRLRALGAGVNGSAEYYLLSLPFSSAIVKYLRLSRIEEDGIDGLPKVDRPRSH